jgi:3'-5' exoribonuclease
MNKCVEELQALAQQQSLGVSAICHEVFDRPEFGECSACEHPEGHHYGLGGLAKHTYEVVTLCMKNADIISGFGNPVDCVVLFLASVFHDVGKIYDYRLDLNLKWVGTVHKRKIHHISRSGLIWSKAVDKTGLFTAIHDDVLHCILSHHGRREWGSPIAPLSREAWILHLCDGLSARSDDCYRIDLTTLGKKPT